MQFIHSFIQQNVTENVASKVNPKPSHEWNHTTHINELEGYKLPQQHGLISQITDTCCVKTCTHTSDISSPISNAAESKSSSYSLQHQIHGGFKGCVCQHATLKQSCSVFLVTLGVMMDRVLLLFGLVVLTTSHAVSVHLLSDPFCFCAWCWCGRDECDDISWLYFIQIPVSPVVYGRLNNDLS